MANETSSQPTLRPAGGTATRLRALVSLVASLVVPPLVYYALSSAGCSDFTAVGWATAVPAVWTATQWAIRRRIDWIGLVATTGYLLALIVALALGSTLILKTHAVLLSGPLGLILLISAIVRRPLLMVLLRALRPEMAERASRPASVGNRRPQGTLPTAIIGLALVAHAGINLALAVTLPTADFLVAEKSLTAVLAVVTLGALLLVRRWLLAR